MQEIPQIPPPEKTLFLRLGFLYGLQNMDDNRLRFWRRLDLIPAFNYFTHSFRDVLRHVVSVLTMLKLCTVLFQLQTYSYAKRLCFSYTEGTVVMLPFCYLNRF